MVRPPDRLPPRSGGTIHARLFDRIAGLAARWRSPAPIDHPVTDLFHTAFESGPTMMVVFDGQWRPLAVNRAFRIGLGYTLETFGTVGWAGVVHPGDGTGQAGSQTTFKRLIAADGTILRAELHFSPMRDADGRHDGRMLVTIEDRTPGWEADGLAHLQASLLDQIGNAVLAVNCQGRILYGNRAAQSLFQWSAQVMVGAAIDRLLEPKVLEAIAAGQDTVESEGRTWSGGRFPAAIAITPITDESGSATSMLLVVTDLTQRHALDLQLMHSSRLATLGEMAASIAHEFNQCLHVIRLASEALRLDLNDGRMDIERFTRRADNILSQVDRLTEMVMQMRTISRRDGDGKRPFRPQQAVDAAIRMVAPLLQADGIKVVREGDLGNVAVLGHPVRLEQLVLNIMINARDAIQDRMRLKGGGGTVIVRCTADAKDVTITVRDDGIGVPEAIGHHIFDPFVTTKDGSRGCGLGLSISRGICTEMGGSLSFANLEDGTVFTIVLPLAAAEPALAPESEAAASNIADDEDSEAHQRRLLVVDDEALSVMMVSEFLERQGYAVDAAYDGIEALTLCGQHVYDAVITDIRMPRMDGRALIKHLAELQPGTPVIVVTGHLKQGSAAELGDNVQAVLPKPFQLLHLRDQLNQLEAAIPRSDHHPVEEE